MPLNDFFKIYIRVKETTQGQKTGVYLYRVGKFGMVNRDTPPKWYQNLKTFNFLCWSYHLDFKDYKKLFESPGKGLRGSQDKALLPQVLV